MSFNFDKLDRILAVQTSDIRELVEATGYDPMFFFRGADLRGLDLSSQDLTGMNFDFADFRDSDLSKIKFDVGAFNNSVLPNKFNDLKDVYDLDLADLSRTFVDKMHLFFAFRPLTFSSLRKGAKLPFTEIAKGASVSTRTIRNADDGHPVTNQTAHSISRFLNDRNAKSRLQQFRIPSTRRRARVQNGQYSIIYQSELQNETIAFADSVRYHLRYVPMPRISLEQPLCSALELLPAGGFRKIRKDEFRFYLDVAEDNKTFFSNLQGLLSPSFLRMFSEIDIDFFERQPKK